MERFFLIIIIIYLIVCPFYVFPSGLPQPADIIVAIGGTALVFYGRLNKVIGASPSKKLIRLVCWIFLINGSYYLYFLLTNVPNNTLIFSFFYVFNALFFLICLVFLKNVSVLQRHINILALTIIISLCIQTTLGLLGISGRTGSARMTIFFNNPNQLGYFSLLMLSVFAVLPSKYRANIIIALFVISISSYLILLSGSRAALGGVVLLTVFIFIKEGFKIGGRQIVVFLFGVILIPFVLKTDFIAEKVEMIDSRNKRYEGKGVSEWQIRGYDRLSVHPEYILLGAGEGEYKRFNTWHNGEMHSGFGTILFSYGIPGIYLFITFLWSIVKRNPKSGLILLVPVFLYNFTHLGLRDSLFWMLLACIFIILEVEHQKINIKALR